MSTEKKQHQFLLKIDLDIWQRFLYTLPLSITASEKLRKMILDYIIEYEKLTVQKSKLEVDDNENS